MAQFGKSYITISSIIRPRFFQCRFMTLWFCFLFYSISRSILDGSFNVLILMPCLYCCSCEIRRMVDKRAPLVT